MAIHKKNFKNVCTTVIIDKKHNTLKAKDNPKIIL